MNSLKLKIFFLFVGLLLVIQSIYFISNYHATEQEKKRQIESRLSVAVTNFKNQFDRRSYYLAAFAETAAKDFGLKQVFAEDTRSFLVALNNHRNRINADIATAVNFDGKIVGQLIHSQALGSSEPKVKVGPEQGQVFKFMDWFELMQASHLYYLNGLVYQMSFSPLANGDLIVGWIGFGYRIDNALAAEFSGNTGLSAEFLLQGETAWSVLAGSTSQSTDHEKHQMLNSLLRDEMSQDVISVVHPIGMVNLDTVSQQELVAVMYGFRDDMLMAIQQRWQELTLLTLLILAVSLTGAYWVAASISRPVHVLARQAKEIASGNYAQPIDYSSKDELGQLAEEFDQMKQAVIKRESTISHQAYHDALTGFSNRHQLLLTLQKFVQENKKPFVLIHLSAQRMKDVNYSLGHEVGDDVIKEVAARLAAITPDELRFNIGGGAFALIHCGNDNSKEGEDWQCYLSAINEAMAPAFELQNISLHIQVQSGIALYPEHDSSGRKLLQMAGAALQHAQQKNLPQHVYDPALSHNAIERLELISNLNHAIEKEQMVLFYQPKLNTKSDAIEEMEALVRWQHPDKGLVPPDRFIGLAEQTGHIHKLTRWVIESALQQYKTWQAEGVHLPIAVNISVVSLRNPNFYEEVIGLLKKHALTPQAICLEVTESVIVDDPDAIIGLLLRFQEKGFRISIDDYGTGYSSLEQLKRLPVNEIKIDKCFVMNLLGHHEDQVIVQSTIDLAHSLGLDVVAEGVEDQQTLDWLRDKGCDMAQGYYISRPKHAQEITPWLQRTPYFHWNEEVRKEA